MKLALDAIKNGGGVLGREETASSRDERLATDAVENGVRVKTLKRPGRRKIS
jgi:hypothetical protein